MVGLKDILRKLAHGAKVVGYSIAYNVALSEKKRELKKVLLSRFKSKQLDEIARRYDISLSGARRKEDKVDILAEELSFDTVVKLARRYKVKHKDILQEFDSYRARLEAGKIKVKLEHELEEQANEIVAALKEFRPEPVKDEEDLEKQVYQYLKAIFRSQGLPIRRQAQVGGYRIDLLVGLCGIELKVPKSVAQLQRLIGQLEDYTEYLDCVIALILDTGKLKEISTYVERLEDIGIIPVVIKGKLKQKQTEKTKKKTPQRKTKRTKRKPRSRRKKKR